MFPIYHAVFSLIFSIILYALKIFTLSEMMVIFLAAVLIDIDHYFFYIFKNKNLNPWKAYRWFVDRHEKIRKMKPEERSRYKEAIIIFHGLEFYIPLIIISLFSRTALLILIGVIFHVLLDMFDGAMSDSPVYPKISQIYSAITNKNRKELS